MMKLVRLIKNFEEVDESLTKFCLLCRFRRIEVFKSRDASVMYDGSSIRLISPVSEI